jgi:hypothetical protein
MAIDDASKFHERVGSSFKELEGAQAIVEQYPSYAWQIIFGPLFIAMGIYLVWFLWKELNLTPYRRWIVYALSFFVLAVFLDGLEGMDLPSLSSYPARHFLKLVEEFLEMFGTTLFLVAFISVLFDQKEKIHIEFT